MNTEKKLWTFEQMLTKTRRDTDLNDDDPDSSFVTLDEFVGYFNEAITEAESEIMTLNQDYFLTFDYVPLVEGTSEYPLPDNIFWKKIRGLVYSNGSVIYPVQKFKMWKKFEEMAYAEQYSGSEDYRYTIYNPSPGNEVMRFIPPARETAIMPQTGLTPFTPIKRYYIRNANRVPYTGEYCNPEDITPTAVDATLNTLAVDPSVAYITGDTVKFSVKTAATLPSPLVAGTVYYVIALSSTSIKLATTLVNARAGTAIDLTTTGTGYFTMKVAATTAIINATIIDIPECSTFLIEWVKANCFFKDGDPRLQASVAKLEEQRKMMVDTLVESEPDLDDTIQPDLSFYTEFS